MRAVKLLLPLLALTLFATACSNSNATRRGMYSPAKPSGPYTRSIQDGSWQQGGKPVDEEIKDRRAQQKINAMQVKTPVKAQ